MECKYCHWPDSHVLYTVKDFKKNEINRRRECLGCKERWTTTEILKDKYAAAAN
jgi:transcriptional regulator NrdR family protein